MLLHTLFIHQRYQNSLPFGGITQISMVVLLIIWISGRNVPICQVSLRSYNYFLLCQFLWKLKLYVCVCKKVWGCESVAWFGKIMHFIFSRLKKVYMLLRLNLSIEFLNSLCFEI